MSCLLLARPRCPVPSPWAALTSHSYQGAPAAAYEQQCIQVHTYVAIRNPPAASPQVSTKSLPCHDRGGSGLARAEGR